MDVYQWLSVGLLVGRVVTFTLIALVLRLQLQLIRSNVYPEYQQYRKILFSLSFVSLAGNFVPIVIDIAGIFSASTTTMLIVYVLSNNFTALLQAISQWLLYHYKGTPGEEGP